MPEREGAARINGKEIMSPALEEPNVYSHGHQSDEPAPEKRNVPAMTKSRNAISLLTELAEISQSSLFYKHSVPNGTVAGCCKAETRLIDG